MTNPTSGKRLVATLWFVAAGLAAIAFALSFRPGHQPNFGVAAGGLSFLTMGIITLRANRWPPGSDKQ